MTGFTTAGSFPFAVGDEIMIESTSVGIASTNPEGQVVVVDTGKGYNTENYDYKLFVVSGVEPNIGGVGFATFSLSNYLATGESPGTYSANLDLLEELFQTSFPNF